VFISVDMEGIAGVTTTDQVGRGGHGYPRAQAMMTAEANAAIRGAFDAGAESVTVSDSHGTMDNLLHDDLDPRARLVFGRPRAQCMMHGLGRGFDVALFVGYHAAAGTHGVLAHTVSSHFAGFRLNGEPVSEAELNALYAASVGVPVGMLTGDDAICAVAERMLPGAELVAVKRAEAWTAADSLHPRSAAEAIGRASAAAVANAGRLRPVRIPDRLVVEVEMQVPTAAEVAAQIPGSELVGVRTVRHQLSDPGEILALSSVYSALARQVMQERGHPGR
jgi:D-amino peptidase